VVVTGNGTTLLTSTDTLAGAVQVQNADLRGRNRRGNLTVLGNLTWEAARTSTTWAG